jgi:hypothetical protein
MAKKIANPPAQSGNVAPPAGYEEVSAARGAPWYRPDSGAIVHGFLKGRHTKKDGSPYYQFELIEPTIAYRKPEGGQRGEREEVTVNKGEFINVDEKSQLEALQDLLRDGATWLVWLRAKEQIDIGGGKTVWVFDVKKKLAKAAPPVTTGRIPF